MSKRITLHFDKLGTISLPVQDAMLATLGAVDGDTFDAKDLAISRRGVEFILPAIQSTYGRVGLKPTGIRDLKWETFFDAFGLAATVRFADRDVTVCYVGAVADVLWKGWIAAYAAATQAPKSRGRPKRLQDWNQDREELFALILQRQREHGENVTEAIDSASKIDRKRFSRAFKGRKMAAKLESARQYFYSRKQDSG